MASSKYPEDPSTLSSWVATVIRTVSAAGVDPKPLIEEVGIDPMLLADPEARVPIKKMERFWGLAATATDDPAFGLRVPQYLANASLYALDTLIDAAPTLEAGAQYLQKYLDVLSTGIDVQLHLVGHNQLRIDVDTFLNHIPEAVDATVAAVVNGMLARMGTRVVIESIDMARPQPVDASEYERILGAEVRFDCLKSQIICTTKEDVRAPSPHANPPLEAALQKTLSDYLDRLGGSPLILQLRQEIMSLMSLQEPTLDMVASKLNMSGRTLQRRLIAEGSGYRQLMDEVRKDMAEQLVVNSQLSFTDIAFRLGFRDASNFSRVFRRWFAMSPTDYRQEKSKAGKDITS
ncbi:AraC family transcriptional regulator [Maricurvus nonylphenolicus]|uniref:AraC family transcriptional regulator n=1 Tax=Maricurvus nonylphenolicus TaxID=1008307 RepID=UPI0036F33D48